MSLYMWVAIYATLLTFFVVPGSFLYFYLFGAIAALWLTLSKLNEKPINIVNRYIALSSLYCVTGAIIVVISINQSVELVLAQLSALGLVTFLSISKLMKSFRT